MPEALIYGATGYTAKLCARELIAQGIQPVLAGRSESAREVAESLGCEAAVFSLDDDVASSLSGYTVAINLAGPFSNTQQALIEGCIAAKCHYLDIAGEYPEMQSAYEHDAAAKDAGVMLMPGAGFGVVPTDLAAKAAADRVPGATHLKILYATEGGASRGTLRTVLKDINNPGVRRVDGEFKEALPAESKADFTVAGKTFTAVYNPWRADLFTAGLSTQIPNIETYAVFPGFIVSMMKGRLLWLRNLILKRLLGLFPEGPSEKQLARGSTYVMAVASKGSEEAKAALKGPEAYRFTALTVAALTKRILQGDAAPGFQTPSRYGAELLEGMDGVVWD